MTLGQRISFQRKQKSLTQQQLGEQLNVSAQAISKWENDQAEPDVATIIKLSEIFGISVSELMKGEADPTPEASEPAQTVTAPAPKKPSLGKRVGRALRAHKKLLISIAIVTVLAATAAIILSYVLLSPTSAFNVNRIELDMTMEEVEEILGTPHKQKLYKEIDGYKYESNGTTEDEFSESFLEGLTGKKATVVSATYFYYGGAYGRKLDQINQLEQEIMDFDLDAPLSQLEKLEEKLAGLKADLEDLEATDAVTIKFEDGVVTEVICD